MTACSAAQPRSRWRVSVIPPWRGLERNGLFEGRLAPGSAHSPNGHWLDGFVEMSRRAADWGLSVHTADLLPPADADVVVYLSHPDSPHDVARLKQRHPGLKAVLVTFETSLGARYTFNPANHRPYDAIITYKRALIDHRRYFPLPPRGYYRERLRTGLPFAERRVACLVGTNRPFRYRSGLFTVIKGWRFSPRDWFDYVVCPGELISYRTEVGRECAVSEPGLFDVYGEGWESVPEVARVCKGIPADSTLEYVGRYRYYLALENHSDQDSLISERVWDALWGDAVPVYYGSRRLDEFVPRDCFVDASAFPGPRALLTWLRDVPDQVWQRHRDAGRAFVRGSGVEAYLPDRFARQFLDVIRQVAEQGSGSGA